MKRSVWIGLSALALAVAIPAAASTFVALSPGELVAQSDAIVQGRVLKVSSFWSPSGRLIVSEAMVEVEETIAGSKTGKRTLVAAVKGSDARTTFVLEAPEAAPEKVAAPAKVPAKTAASAKKESSKRAASGR